MLSPTKSALYWTCKPELDITKPSLIFLHASWMSSSIFEETIAHLLPVLPNFNFLGVDVNGHGKTVAGRKTFTLWDQANDVVELMDELKVQKATFIGLSMGCLISLRLALTHPSRVTALVLMAGTATAATPESIAGILQLREMWVATPKPSEDVMDIAVRGWGGNPDTTGARADRIKRYWQERYSGPENVDATLHSLNEREDIRGRLREIKSPVLLIHGELDETRKLEEAEAIRDELINARVRLEIIKGSGHLVIWMRESNDVSKLIGDFVKEIEG